MTDRNNNRGVYLFSKLVQCMDRCRRTNVSDRKKLKMPKMGEKKRKEKKSTSTGSTEERRKNS
jgi:hypothetical protein